MPFGNGDRDRLRVVINPGTFTNEGYRIYCLTIFMIVKGNTDKKMLAHSERHGGSLAMISLDGPPDRKNAERPGPWPFLLGERT
jgi:hypothetical protein